MKPENGGTLDPPPDSAVGDAPPGCGFGAAPAFPMLVLLAFARLAWRRQRG